MKKNIIITGKKGGSYWGKTYYVLNTKTGKEYAVDQQPKIYRMPSGANWVVSEKYGGFISKFRTKRGAMNFIKGLKKVI
jgi:hypothetical protein